VVEDATDIILNLKQIPFKLMARGSRRAPSTWKATATCAAPRIETDADVEVLDRDVHIATVSEGGKPAYRDAA